MKADAEGLDTVLERMENAAERYGERFAPPTILRRLVAQGRLGQKSGQGFYAYPQPDAEQPAEVIKLETRGDGVAIAWLANGQMNSISPQVVEDLAKVWATVKESGVRALVIASSNPFLFSAGADIKAFTTMDEAAGEHADRRRRTRCSTSSARGGSRRSPPSTAWPSAAAASSRWPATCASPRARRCSASPRSSSGSSPASAARSGCRGWSAPTRRSR